MSLPGVTEWHNMKPRGGHLAKYTTIVYTPQTKNMFYLSGKCCLDNTKRNKTIHQLNI